MGPQGAAAGSTLSCTVTGGADADGDPIGWSISWTIDGEVLEGEEGPELNSPLVVKGAVVGCSATPSDGFEAGEQVTSGNELIIDNTPPNAATVSLLPDVATVQSELSC